MVHLEMNEESLQGRDNSIDKKAANMVLASDQDDRLARSILINGLPMHHTINVNVSHQ